MCDRGEQDERGVKGENDIEGDKSNVLDVMAKHLPIQLATRYFIKYHVSEDRSRNIELVGGVDTLRCVSVFHEPAWHFDAKSVDAEGRLVMVIFWR